jgi:hypothetical protein
MSRFAFTYEDPDYGRDDDVAEQDDLDDSDEQPEDNYYGA